MSFSYEDLKVQQRKIEDRYPPDKVWRTVEYLNRMDRLTSFLELLELSDEEDIPFGRFKNGQIAIIGQCDIQEKDIHMAANKAGINKKRIEVYGNYEDIKRTNFDFCRNEKYCLILAGPQPHMNIGTEGYSSLLVRMEDKTNGFPPVLRLEQGGNLKISNSAITKALNDAIEREWIEKG